MPVLPPLGVAFRGACFLRGLGGRRRRLGVLREGTGMGWGQGGLGSQTHFMFASLTYSFKKMLRLLFQGHALGHLHFKRLFTTQCKEDNNSHNKPMSCDDIHSKRLRQFKEGFPPWWPCSWKHSLFREYKSSWKKCCYMCSKIKIHIWSQRF